MAHRITKSLSCSLLLTISLPLLHLQSSAIPVKHNQQGDNQQAELLEPGKPIERELVGGQSHSYRITLATGQCIKVRVDQLGIDVLLRLVGPDDKQIADFDSERRLQGEENAFWVAEEAGGYRLDVIPRYKREVAGRYRVQIIGLGVATESDRVLHEAQKLNTEFLGLYRSGKYDEARLLGERVLEVRERALGENHPDVAHAVTNLAGIYFLKGDLVQAEALFQRALAIRERALGPDHPDVAASLSNLARLYNIKGVVAKSEAFYQRAIIIVERALGQEHPDLAATLINYADLCFDRADYVTAEPLFQRALAICEKKLGPEHPYFAIVLNNLAALYRTRGDYARAKPLLQRSLTTYEKAYGPDHSKVANALINLANLYYDLGDNEKAEPLFQRALAIREKALGLDNIELARPLENLAELYKDSGDYAKAEPLYLRALAIREKTLGPDHQFVAHTLVNLARFYSERGDYARAEPLFQRALLIAERAVGMEHPGLAEVLGNLANLYRDRGDYAGAEPLYRRALEIREKVFGPKHPEVADTLSDLARCYAAKGDYRQALTALSRANDIEEHNFTSTLAIGSERQKLLYLSKFSEGAEFTLSLHGLAAPDDVQALDLAFTTLLCRKGRVLDAMTDTIATLRRQATPEDSELFDRLKDARSRFASLMLSRAEEENLSGYRTRVKDLGDKIDELEGKLSDRSAVFRQERQQLTLSAVQAALPAHGVLVEFAFFTPQLPRAGVSAQPRYRAYLLAPQGRPKWVDLGEAAPLDQAIEAWRKALRDPSRTDVKKLARAVDEKLMRPVRSLIANLQSDTDRLLIAPDGALGLIPFAALYDEQNRYLIERYSISYLTSGRDLLRLQLSEPSKEPPLVVANPDFGRFSALAMRERGNSLKPRAGEFYFQPLPATEDEALAIKALLPEASVLLGDDATEKALKGVKGPELLHIATHGFFLKKKEVQPLEEPAAAAVAAAPQSIPYTVQIEATPLFETAQAKVKRLGAQGIDAYILKSRAKRRRGSGGYDVFFRVRTGEFSTWSEARKFGAELQAKGIVSEFFIARKIAAPVSALRIGAAAAQIKDPLLRSGLALAGANQGQNGDDDGILTALEAAYLDLAGTKLVVLSACDTGVGEVKKGEGVQGLRRALVLAGSESQVMSLWPVADEATKDLMTGYYQALKQGEERSEGLRQVQLRMLRGRKDRQHPFYWAAFIQSGAWTQLEGRE